MIAQRRLTQGMGLLFAVTLVAVANADETIHIKVDVASPAGKIRRLHGTNLAAPLDCVARDNSQDLKELDIPLTRLHDAPLENRGWRLVDVSRVFPLFHLDPQDPNNYYFAQTDDYIANCLAYGSKVLYRLGESMGWLVRRQTGR